ncbi:hypothetical protein BKA70DRAFT_4282 [Coprinopsis sp. MPI-PUGE-AT-0042]|nr:hypothetical protein BKA70DRAFT_4282 [Coprinopsis sp. MPI-PUGE-AT-0042]
MTDIGTKHFPIIIDGDSEDEISYQLTKPAPASYPESPGYYPSGGPSPIDSGSVATPYGHGISGGQYVVQDQHINDHQPGQALKRRRSSSPDGQRPAKQARPLLEDRLSNPVQQPNKPKPKKSKNKQEKVKRQQLRVQQQENLRRLRHAPGLEPQVPLGHNQEVPIDNPFLLLRFNQTPEMMRAMGYTPALPDSNYPAPPPLIHGDPSFSWPSNPMPWPSHPPYPTDPLPFRPPPPSLPPPPPPPTSLPPKPVTHPPIPIGMKPDQDPQSKHGIFDLSSQTLEDGHPPYNPNPARTLVMEQLPKNWRSHDQLHSWGRQATGHPNPIAKILVDSKASRALLEFVTADLARKGWESPRLGAQYAGLKSHQLKGKHREDLIRVWWYRVSGVGARQGVGEIEEGEIEDGPSPLPKNATSVADGTDQIPKESKKDRKARLNRERQQKAHLEHLMRRAPPPPSAELAYQHQIPASSSNHHSLPLRPVLEMPLRVAPGAPAEDGMSVDDDDDNMDLASPSQSDAPAGPDKQISNPLVTFTQSHIFTPSGPVVPAKPSLKEGLEARERRLQEEITRLKLKPAQQQPSGPMAFPATLPASTIPVSDSKKESQLRELVLQSRKPKPAAAVAKPVAPTPVPPVSMSDTPKFNATQDPASPLDEADSFIKQAIETAKALPSSLPEPPAVPLVNRAPTSGKAELELKRQRLEQHISQAKALMGQLDLAKTKQERDFLKAKLNELEHQRSADEEANVSPVSARPMVSAGLKQPRATSSSFWPRMETENHAFIWSDDEDDGDDE